MKYIHGIANKEYEIAKTNDHIILSLAFISEHRHLFVGDSINLINGDAQISFLINSVKYSRENNNAAVRLDAEDCEYFTILEVEKIYEE
jgi:hypothetical protein